jgi:hypothetical protein
MLALSSLAAALLLLSGAPADSTRRPPGVASLHVVATDKGQPLVYSQVLLYGTRRGANTDEHGRATIDSIPPGKWEVRWLSAG